MSLLDGMTQDVKEKATDSLGGTTFLVDSDLHKFTIEVAYLEKAKSGAIGLQLHLKGNGSFLRQSLWIRSGDAKGNNTYYVNAKGDKQNLPGFSQANQLVQLLIDPAKKIMDMASQTDEKIIKLFNYDAKGDVDTKVEMITDMVGKEVVLGMHKQAVEKTAYNQSTKKYDTVTDTAGRAYTVDKNEINKIFDGNGLTVAEREGGMTEPVFAKQWADKWKDQIVDKTKAKTGRYPMPKAGDAPTTPAAAAGDAAAPTTTSIFD